jgi:ketosteroid isomerase-like protein
MSEQDNVRIVQEAYAAFGRGDIATVLNALTSDVEWEIPGPGDVPISGVRRGPAEVQEFFKTLSESEDIQQFEPRDFLAAGDKVAVVGHYRSVIRSTGRTSEMDWVHVLTVRDGKIASFKEFTDTLAIAKAYGVGLEAASAT